MSQKICDNCHQPLFIKNASIPKRKMSKLFPHGFPQKGEIYQINFSPSREKRLGRFILV